jgi:ubiquinone biosynthesis protein
MKQMVTNFYRLFSIQRILAKHGLDKMLSDVPVFRALRFLSLLNPRHFFQKAPSTRGPAIKSALEELGPIFVKFGQALSTRQDLLPDDIALSLTELQDNVKPFNGELAVAAIEECFQQGIEQIFASFEKEPLASASIAQVHSATLNSGEEVAVKVLRPNVKKRIEQDLALMRFIARLVQKYHKQSHRLKPMAIVAEFEKTILDELDLVQEAASASLLRRNFNQSELLYVPKVYFDYCKKNILVTEKISGIPINDVKALDEHKINRRVLAERGVEIFFTQVFFHSFFHADMHAGNIFVSQESPELPQYICVDFGIMGSLSEFDKKYLALNLLAFFNRDYQKVAKLHFDSGWVNPKASLIDFESAIRTVCEPIFEKPLKDISFAEVFMRLLQVGQRFEMEVQPQLLLIQKTLFAVEGLGRTLYPDLNIFQSAKPILEKWLKHETGVKNFLGKLKANLPFLYEELPNLPHLVVNTLKSQKGALQEKAAAPPPLTKSASLFSLALILLPSSTLLLSTLLNKNLMSAIVLGSSLVGALLYWKSTSKCYSVLD